MAFSSINFVFILPVLLLVYWALPASARRIWLLVASVTVYMAAGWADLALLVGVTWINWLSHRLVPSSPRVRKAMIVLDVLILGWFKYRLFIAANLGVTTVAKSLIIPLGISFYIFQLISYQVEIMKGILKERPTFLAFLLYIFFFPHHQAGPIMRPHAFLGAFLHGRRWMRGRFKMGLLIFLWGLFKKIWIADFLIGPQVSERFAAMQASHGMTGNILLLSVLYGIQIYADFSGYSDIAVGVGRMFGFKLDRNFHQPYIARGPSEFWRRWHVTLSQWLRDYLYIPFGGNRKGAVRTRINLLAVMLIGGFWHGAGWAFVIWGFLHGLYLILETWVDPWLKRIPLVKFVLFQTLIMLAWMPFREPNLRHIWNLASRSAAWTGPETLAATLLMMGIVGFSRLEDGLERHFVALARFSNRLAEPWFLLGYHALLFTVLAGVKYESGFIYQRF